MNKGGLIAVTGEGEKQGLVSLLDAAVTAADQDEERQMDLLSAEPGASPLDAALERMAQGFRKPRRGRGRPQGSRNRRTEDWARLVLSTHRSPLLVLADFYSMPVEELAGRLQCDLLDAAKLQMAAAVALAPYVHQRLPQAVNLDVNGSLPTLVLNIGGHPAAENKIVEIQDLSAELPGYSDSGVSDGLAQAAETAGESAVHPTDLGSAS